MSLSTAIKRASVVAVKMRSLRLFTLGYIFKFVIGDAATVAKQAIRRCFVFGSNRQRSLATVRV